MTLTLAQKFDMPNTEARSFAQLFPKRFIKAGDAVWTAHDAHIYYLDIEEYAPSSLCNLWQYAPVISDPDLGQRQLDPVDSVAELTGEGQYYFDPAAGRLYVYSFSTDATGNDANLIYFTYEHI